jgi:hypothetical protein
MMVRPSGQMIVRMNDAIMQMTVGRSGRREADEAEDDQQPHQPEGQPIEDPRLRRDGSHGLSQPEV